MLNQYNTNILPYVQSLTCYVVFKGSRCAWSRRVYHILCCHGLPSCMHMLCVEFPRHSYSAFLRHMQRWSVREPLGVAQISIASSKLQRVLRYLYSIWRRILRVRFLMGFQYEPYPILGSANTLRSGFLNKSKSSVHQCCLKAPSDLVPRLKTCWSTQCQKACTDPVCLCCKAVCNDNSKYAMKVCESKHSQQSIPMALPISSSRGHPREF